MTREEAYSRIDAIIAKYEIDEEYVTITNLKDYDALRMAREILEQEPTDTVSRGVFEQVMWERDIAIEQLNELGYELGQKIEQMHNYEEKPHSLLDAYFQMRKESNEV